MKKKSNKPEATTALRQRAEAQWQAHEPSKPKQAAPLELERLVHELEVHQIELELQQEELIQSRAETEQTLAQFIELYDFAPVGYLTLTRAGTIQQANLTSARLLSRERAQLISRRFGTFVAAESLPAFNDYMQQIFEDQIQAPCELALAQAGPVLWVQIMATHLLDEQTCRVALEDITERKQVELALRQAEEKYHTIFENSIEAINQTTPDGKFITVSPSGARMLGYRSSEELLANIGDIQKQFYVEPGRREEFIRLMDEHGSLTGFESQIYRRDGSRIWITENSRAVRNQQGQLLHYEGTALDITERRQTNDQLLEQQRLLNETGRLAKVGGWEIQLPAQTLVWTEEVCRIHEVEPGFQPTTAQAIAFYAPESKPMIAQAVSAAIEQGKSFDLELRLITAKGNWLWVHVFGQVQDNKVSGAIQDITEAKQAEANLLESQTQLQGLLESSNLSRQVLLSVIEDRDQVETALRASEARYRLATLATQDVIWEWNLATNQLLWSENSQAIFGYSSAEVGPYETWWEEHVHPEDLPRLLSKLDEVIKSSETVWWDEYRFQLKDGSYAYISDHGYIEREANNQVLRMIGAMSNITERKQAEKSLKESEERFQSLFRAIPVPTYTWQLVGDALILVDFNEMARAISGGKITDLLGSEASQMYGEDEQALHDLRQCIQQKTTIEREMEYDLKATGEHKYLSVKYAFVPPDLVMVHTEDFTERKQAEAELKNSHSLLNATLESTADGILVVASDGKVSSFNRKFLELWQIPSNLAEKKDDHALLESIVNQLKYPDKFIAEVEALYITPEAVSFDELEFLDGRIFERYSLPQRLGDTIVGRVWNFRNITQRKQAENALRNSEERFRSLFDRMLDGLYRSTHAGKFVDINPAMVKMFGYASEAEMLAVDIKRDLYFEPTERGSHILDTGQEEVDIYRMRRKDGSEIWVEDRGSYVHDEQGNIIYHEGILRDVTERKQTENELRASEERFRQLADNIQEVFWIADAVSGEDLYISPAGEKVWGHALEDLLRVPNIFIDSILSEDRLAVLHTLKKQRMGYPTEAEYRFIHSDGSVHWVWDRAFPIFDVSGKVVRIAGIAADITERKRVEYESHERLKETTCLYAVRSEIGRDLTSEELCNRIIQHLTSAMQFPEIAAPVIKLNGSQFASQKYTEPLTHLIQTDILVQKVVVGQLQVFYTAEQSFIIPEEQNLIDSIANDLGLWLERQQAELEIKYHLAELEVLYESGLAINRLLEPQEIGEKMLEIIQQKLDWHHAAVRLYDPQSDQLELIALGDPRYNAAELKAEIARLNQIITTSDTGLSGWVVKHGDVLRVPQVKQEARYIETFPGIQSGLYVPIHTGGHTLGSIAVESELENAFTAADERLLLTIANQAAIAIENAQLYALARQELEEREKAQAELEKTQSDLEHRVEARTEDFKRSNINLARALRIKDEFLANMSHELRTPLNAILGLSESLAEQTAGPLNEKQQKYLATVTESGRHLLSLINDILDLAKIEAGQVKLELDKVDINSICDASLRMIKQLAQKKNQTTSLEIDKTLGLMWVDERRLKQMLVNLLSNAVKFTPNDGKLGLEVHGNSDKNQVTFTIWDTGIGIKEADLPRLFQTFVQLDSGLARESSGTGLGLALVAQMARLHGGSTNVVSQLGAGSRFTIVLPWEPALVVDPIERLKSTGKFRPLKFDQTHKPTILLIEDTEEVIMLLSDYLELNGFHVIIARDGIEGVSQAQTTKPDLILMDIQMPRMDGFEATRRLRSQPEFSNTPIIALTALAMANDRERCLAAGMDEYITKPIHLRALIKTIETFLGGEKELKHS
ncbi:MAG: PAS domain S-box protein [Chloroflexota bacterium]